MAANAVGFNIADVALTGQKHLSREEILATAGVTGRASLLFIDVADARARLTPIRGSPKRRCRNSIPIACRSPHRARSLCAVAEGRPRRRHRRRRHRARTLCVAPLHDLPLVRRRRRGARGKDFLTLLDRFPDIRDSVRAAVLVAERRWNLRLKNGSRRPAAGDRCRAGARPRSPRSTATCSCRRTSPWSICAAGPHYRAAVGRRRAGARGSPEEEEAEDQGRQRMSPLNYGLTPKMKPLPPSG